MTIENCHYTLKIRGRSIGSQVLRSQENRRIVYLESKLSLQGSLDEKVVKQSSRLYRPDFHSLYFREENQDKNHKRSYEVRFDRDEGLVKVFKDGGDNATAPYIQPYQDPLGLLYQLRFIPVEQEYVRIPMLGRDVTVRQLPEVELELAGEPKIARVFELHPGGSLVYIDSEVPHNILKLNQRIGQQVIEAELESFEKEDGFLNDDIRRSNRRNRSSRSGRGSGRSGRGGNRNNNRGRSRGGRSGGSGRSNSGRSGSSRNDKDGTSSTRGKGQGNSSKDGRSRDNRSRDNKSRNNSSRDNSARDSNSKNPRNDSSDSKGSGSSRNSNRSKRSRPPKNARSRRDSYQRSHKRSNSNSDKSSNSKPKESE